MLVSNGNNGIILLSAIIIGKGLVVRCTIELYEFVHDYCQEDCSSLEVQRIIFIFFFWLKSPYCCPHQ